MTSSRTEKLLKDSEYQKVTVTNPEVKDSEVDTAITNPVIKEKSEKTVALADNDESIKNSKTVAPVPKKSKLIEMIDEAVIETLNNAVIRSKLNIDHDQLEKLTKESKKGLKRLIKGDRESEVKEFNTKMPIANVSAAETLNVDMPMETDLKRAVKSHGERLEVLKREMQTFLVDSENVSALTIKDDIKRQEQEQKIETLKSELFESNARYEKNSSSREAEITKLRDALQKANEELETYKNRAIELEGRYTKNVGAQKEVVDEFRNTMQVSYTQFLKEIATIWEDPSLTVGEPQN